MARMPYFSYISMLHLYESLGWWRVGAELRKVSYILALTLHLVVVMRVRFRFKGQVDRRSSMIP